MKGNRRRFSFLSGVLILLLTTCLFAVNVAAADTWDDTYDFYSMSNVYITAKDPGSGDAGTVYMLWNTSSPLTGNWTATAKISMDTSVTQADHAQGQKASLILGDDTDPEAEPSLVALLEVQYYNENGGKIWSLFQFWNGTTWVNSAATVNTWPTDLGNDFVYEVKKVSDTTVHVKLTAVKASSVLIDLDVEIGTDAMALIKSYGVATRTGFEGFTVPAGESWDDTSDFYTIPRDTAVAKDPGSGDAGTVYMLWNTTSLLTGNWTASTKVIMDTAVTQGEHAQGQKASLILGDDTDLEAEPSLVALLEVQYYNENNGKIWSLFQFWNGTTWVNSAATINTWPTDLGNVFQYEIKKISDTAVHVKLTAVKPSTVLIDLDVEIGTDAMSLIKSYGVATRTGFEMFTEMQPYTDVPVATPTTAEATPTEAANPQTSDFAYPTLLLMIAFVSGCAFLVAGKKALYKS